MKITEQRDAYISADAEGRAKILAKTYGLSAHQMWKHKQSGKWIISHAGVQSIAAQEGVNVDYSVVVAGVDMVIVMATPRIGKEGLAGQSTFGEASPQNTTQKYPMAMAEKRSYDRAVLITVLQMVGGYGGDFYGEDEADDFKKPADVVPVAKKDPDHQPPTKELLIKHIQGAKTLDTLERLDTRAQSYPQLYDADVRTAYCDMRDALMDEERG